MTPNNRNRDGELERKLIALYRESTTKLEFQQKVFRMSKDPQLVKWATAFLFGSPQSTEEP